MMRAKDIAAILIACAGSVIADVLPAELEGMNTNQLAVRRNDLQEQLSDLHSTRIDPPPARSDDDSRDAQIAEILRLEVELWAAKRYYDRRLMDGMTNHSRTMIDESWLRDPSPLHITEEGDDIVAIYPLRYWSAPTCRIHTSWAALPGRSILLFQYEYDGEPHGLSLSTQAVWRLQGQATNRNTFSVRQYPDRIGIGTRLQL